MKKAAIAIPAGTLLSDVYKQVRPKKRQIALLTAALSNFGDCGNRLTSSKVRGYSQGVSTDSRMAIIAIRIASSITTLLGAEVINPPKSMCPNSVLGTKKTRETTFCAARPTALISTTIVPKAVVVADAFLD